MKFVLNTASHTYKLQNVLVGVYDQQPNNEAAKSLKPSLNFLSF